jgi:hypothetical protein
MTKECIVCHEKKNSGIIFMEMCGHNIHECCGIRQVWPFWMTKLYCPICPSSVHVIFSWIYILSVVTLFVGAGYLFVEGFKMFEDYMSTTGCFYTKDKLSCKSMFSDCINFTRIINECIYFPQAGGTK